MPLSRNGGNQARQMDSMNADKTPGVFEESGPNILKTSKEIFVGTGNNKVHINPNKGIGLGEDADTGAKMVARGQYFSRLYVMGSGTTFAIDWDNGNVQSCSVTGNATFTLADPKTGGRYALIITQDATGGRTYTWPSAVKWPASTAPTASGANKTDLITFIYDGTYYYGGSNLNY